MEHPKLRLLLPWDEIEQGAQEQIQYLLDLPFLRILAIMPDIHQGFLAPIGSVARLQGVISPAFVGVDIGCGMSHCQLPVKVSTLTQAQLLEIRDKIKAHIPMGFSINSNNHVDYPYGDFESASHDLQLNDLVMDKLYSSYGTLGGGNHFIELGVSRNTGNLGITIHSGSRNPGYRVAEFWMNVAKEEQTELPEGFLYLCSDRGQEYLQDMEYMQSYALHNREKMMSIILNCLRPFCDFDKTAVMFSLINENHNHAIVEHERVLHRKGATPAAKDQLGIIPGNMRDGVYITRGLGNQEFLESASHGAGRTCSRSKARKECDMGLFKEQMKGIVWDDRETLKDENPEAYKNLDTVIKYQEGVVIEVVDKFDPVINLKG